MSTNIASPTFAEVGGRLHNVSGSYRLPIDDDEWSRLNKQHIVLSYAQGGLLPAPAHSTINAILRAEDDKPKAILDLGTGSGVWCIEMAKAFPHAKVFGIDKTPVPNAHSAPSNCIFEVHDLNLGLSKYREQFDIVHARAIGIGLKNALTTIEEATRCLKPGGAVFWLDGDYDAYSSWPSKYLAPLSDDNPNGSAFSRLLYESRRSAIKFGGDVSRMVEAMDRGLWDQSELIDPETVKAANVYLPMGTWLKGDTPEKTSMLQRMGELLREDFINATKGMEAMLLGAGWTAQELEQWVKKALEELKTDPIGVRARMTWGRRREGPKQPAPNLNFQDSKGLGLSPHPVDYPYFELYYNQEQSLEAKIERDMGKDINPPSSPGPKPLEFIST